jgi:hypothetical protein
MTNVDWELLLDIKTLFLNKGDLWYRSLSCLKALTSVKFAHVIIRESLCSIHLHTRCFLNWFPILWSTYIPVMAFFVLTDCRYVYWNGVKFASRNVKWWFTVSRIFLQLMCTSAAISVKVFGLIFVMVHLFFFFEQKEPNLQRYLHSSRKEGCFSLQLWNSQRELNKRKKRFCIYCLYPNV